MNNKILIGILCTFSLAFGIDYNKELLNAVERGDKTAILMALARGADIEITEAGSRYTPLFIAVANADTDIVVLLLQKGANINAKDSRGFTPLCLAIDNVQPGLVKVLLENPDVKVFQQDWDILAKKEREIKDSLSKGLTKFYESDSHRIELIKKMLQDHEMALKR